MPFLRYLMAVAFFVLCGATAQAEPRPPVSDGAQCTFADESYTAKLRLAFLVGEYYQVHQEWPQHTGDFLDFRDDEKLDQTAMLAFSSFGSVKLHHGNRDLFLVCQLADANETIILQLSPAKSIIEIVQTLRETDQLPSKEKQRTFGRR